MAVFHYAASGDHHFWQHKDLLDSLVTALDYYRCLYTRLAQTLDSSSSMHNQLSVGQSAVQALLAAVQRVKAETDAEAERVYPSLLSYGQKPHSKQVLALRCVEWSDMVHRHKQQLAALWTQHKAAELPFVQQSEGLRRLFLDIEQTPQQGVSDTEQLSDEEAARLQRRADNSLHRVVTNIQELVLAISDTAHTQRDEQLQETAEGGDSDTSLVEEFVHHASVLTVKRTQAVRKSKREQQTLFQQLRASLDNHLHNVARLAQQPNTATAFSAALASLHSLVPALQQCTLVAQRSITSALAFLRSATKLDYVLLSSFNTLLTHGYCGKDNEHEKQDSGMTDEGVEGTGMGEGEGDKGRQRPDSQEEQQLEGLRGGEGGGGRWQASSRTRRARMKSRERRSWRRAWRWSRSLTARCTTCRRTTRRRRSSDEDERRRGEGEGRAGQGDGGAKTTSKQGGGRETVE